MTGYTSLRKESKNKSDTLINVNIRESVQSLRGVLILFKDVGEHHEKVRSGKREKWYNPKIEDGE